MEFPTIKHIDKQIAWHRREADKHNEYSPRHERIIETLEKERRELENEQRRFNG